jgi:hypothetical protein
MDEISMSNTTAGLGETGSTRIVLPARFSATSADVLPTDRPAASPQVTVVQAGQGTVAERDPGTHVTS